MVEQRARVSAITPFLWFVSQAEEAANFYVATFEGGAIANVSRYGDDGPGPAGSAMVVEFELAGQSFMALNGGQSEPPPNGPVEGSIALFVSCPTQAAVDTLWERLGEGGAYLQCGWLRDKFGVTWNIVPEGLSDLLGGPDPEGAGRAMQAMLSMTKLDIDALRRAYDGN